MFDTSNPIIKYKVGSLNLARENSRVAKSECHTTRLTAIRGLAAEGGIDTLINRNRRMPNSKNRTTERAVVEYAIEFPDHSQTVRVMSCVKQIYLSRQNVRKRQCIVSCKAAIQWPSDTERLRCPGRGGHGND